MQPGRVERHERDLAGPQLSLDRREGREPDGVAGQHGRLGDGKAVEHQVRREVAGVAVHLGERHRLGDVHGDSLRDAGGDQREHENGFEREVGAGYERVALAGKEEHPVLGDRLDRKPGRVSLGTRRVGDGELEPGRDHGPAQLIEVAEDGMDAQPRVGGRHAAEGDAERQFGGEHVGAEDELRRLQAGEFLEVAGQVARLREDPVGVVDDQAAGLAGPERLGGPVHELESER